ncbi:MAG: DUF2812 domain-containing protein [Bacillota bacterium]
MKKFIIHRLFWDYEKEERWLNQMASKGMNFIDFTFARYLFEQGTPGEYIYRIELLSQPPTHPESQEYIKFMESVGVEYMGKWVRWVYFRKKASDGPFEIFSDYDSRIKHYKRVSTLFGTLGIINLLGFMFNIFNGITIGSQYNYYLSPIIALNGGVAIGFAWLVIGYTKKILRLKKEKLLHE